MRYGVTEWYPSGMGFTFFDDGVELFDVMELSSSNR